MCRLLDAAGGVFGGAGAFETGFISFICFICTRLGTSGITAATVGRAAIVGVISCSVTIVTVIGSAFKNVLEVLCFLAWRRTFLIFNTVVDIYTACICTILSATVVNALGVCRDADIDHCVMNV